MMYAFGFLHSIELDFSFSPEDYLLKLSEDLTFANRNTLDRS